MDFLPRITVRLEGENIYVSSPYHPHFSSRAKTKMAGKWTGEIWIFDRRLERHVRSALVQIYGWDGSYPVLIADVLVKMDHLPWRWRRRKDLWMLGRMLAERIGRDSPVQLGPGVVLECGDFPGSGGSLKYPALEWNRGTVLLVLDVPVTLVKAVQGKYPRAVEELPGTRRNVLGEGQVIRLEETQKMVREVTRRLLLFVGEEG